MFENLMLKDFADKLSSAEPTPGGGSVSALCASLACSLSSMVFNLTIDKQAFSKLPEEKRKLVLDSLKETSALQFEFLALMDQDGEGFMELMDSFRLPKNTDEEKEIRNKKIQEGYKKSLSTPLETSKSAIKIYDYIYVACELGNKNLISDAGVAAMLLQTAIESAILNVKVNLPGIKDEAYKKEINIKCDELLNLGNMKKNDILKKVYGIINIV